MPALPRRDLFALLALALLVHMSAAQFIRAPGYMDDAYYFGGALRLAQGQGFTEPYLWNYLDSPTGLPHPSHLYWMPLTSVVAAASMAAFGQSFAAARLPLVLLASLLPLMAYAVAMQLTGVRRQASAAGLITLFSGFYPAFWGTTDSFALFAVTGAGTLFAIGRGMQTGRWQWWLAAGVGAGLAHLTRADGLLLLAVGLLLALTSRRYPHTPILFLGYSLVTLPWFIRNTQIAGSPFGAGGGALWLVQYNDLFNYPPNLSAAQFFAAGWRAIALSKWQAVTLNLQTIIAVQGLVFMAPLIALGLWRLRRHALIRPVLAYAALLYAAMTFAFSLPGARGGLFHSGVALLPFYMPLGMIGLDAAVDWVAGRRKTWDAETAKRVFTGGAVGLAILLTVAMLATRLPSWNNGDALFREIGAVFPGDAGVMSNNPPGFWVATGHPGVMVPNGNVSTLLAVADKFGMRYVLLDRNYPAGLAELYRAESGERLTLVGRWDEWKLFEVSRP